jgi:SAM-dependent methyltransferase
MANPPDTGIDGQRASRSFDTVAELYDAYRPGYPEELLEALVAMTGLPADGKILEIGSGTGKATLMFARRGYSIRCIEPGQNLIDIAARNVRDYPRVEFEAVAFEDWPERPAEFDLVMSAQAFHWVPKEVGYAKAARALRDGGHLALFWNMAPREPSPLVLELNQVYQEQVPEMADVLDSCQDVVRQRETEIRESGFFCDVRTVTFPWSARYNTRQYLGLLSTYSDHIRLSNEKRKALFDGVAEVIERHGGTIDRPYVAALHVARKCPA